MSKQSLVGQNGNAYALMGYTANVLKKEGLEDLKAAMFKEATSGDYYNLIAVCDKYIDMANAKAVENGYEEDCNDDF